MNKYFAVLFFFLFLFGVSAQTPMEVVRTKAVDRYAPVTNIFIEGENKWVGNKKGLFQVHSPEQSTNANLSPSEWSLLQTPSGNRDLRFPLEDLLTQMGADGKSIRAKEDRITAAIFEEKGSQLWVGTRKSGLFQFKTQPSLKLVAHHSPGGSDNINTLFIDTEGRLWIGTDEGCLFGKDGKWRQEQKVFSIRAFTQSGTNIWVMGDDLLWKVDAREKWDPIDIDASLTEGEVVDIAMDGNGMLWIASQIITRFDPATEEATVFGPAEEFTSQDVSCMAIDADNAVWIGTNDKGLYLIQKADAMAVTCLLDHPLSCGAGAKDASLKVTVDGGTAPYIYNWAGGLAGTNPQNLGPGEYSLTVTDSKGKSKLTKFTIPDPNIKLIANQDKPASEDGSADGVASIKVSGGNPSYSYKWDNGETTEKAVRLGEGLHSITVTDKSGCMASTSIEVKRLVAALNVVISQTKAIACAGSKDAALKAEASGGKTPYQYQWNTTPSLMSSNSLSGLPPGGYFVTVTDAVGQSATASFEVKNAEPVAATIKVDASASTGNSDGKATVKASGGSGNFTYKWDSGETTVTSSKLSPGSHTVTVTDASGCTATAIVNISENILPLSATIAQQNEIKCFGEKTAMLRTTVRGGKEPFKYKWSIAESYTELANSVSAGTYSLTVTDATGQTTTASIEVVEPKAINLTAKVDAPASTGNSDGKATVKSNGGTGSFSFKWDNGETSAAATKLGPGNHSVTVTDASGCTATATVSITENILPLSVSILQESEIKCAGEKSAALKADVNGGKGPFRFTWAGGASSETVASLGAGNYDVTVTDATGATSSDKITIKDANAINLIAKVDASASTGNSDGKATAKASGGAGNFSFKWDNGETSATATKLVPGNRSVTVTDASGCTAIATVSITENILPLSVSITQESEIKCAGEKTASLKAEVSGGKGPFQFAWTGGSTSESVASLGIGSYVVTITDATGTTSTAVHQVSEPSELKAEVVKIRPATTDKTNNGKATLEASGGTGKYIIAWDNAEAETNATTLPAGQRSVTVTDDNGCAATVSFEVKTRIIPELSANNLRSGETIKLEKIYFQPDSTQMEEDSKPTLNELYEFLQENPNIVIEVGGHTNGIPSHEFCDQLSSARAKSVAQYLVDLGLPTSRITYKGYGKRNPVASNSTPEGRAKNQRVEIKIVRTE